MIPMAPMMPVIPTNGPPKIERRRGGSRSELAGLVTALQPAVAATGGDIDQGGWRAGIRKSVTEK